ncbi:nitroreductase family protein [Ensifer sp. 4252]|uniref:nitroreductase family protein n=1 Tax=Ensifer sp. 4252 TaxID=3373915 RepID=UPI003D197E6A
MRQNKANAANRQARLKQTPEKPATFAGATLMYAAQAFGLASCPMGGFDPDGVAREFALGPQEIPVMLLAVGHGEAGNWPPKPRRAVADALGLA